MSTESSLFDLIVWTDKLDYAPGEYANFTVEGVPEGGTVELQVLHVDDPGVDGEFGTPDDVLDAGPDQTPGTADDGYGTTGAGHDPFLVTDGVYEIDFGADGVEGTVDDLIIGDQDMAANGVVVAQWYVNPDDSLGETFLLTATGVDVGADGTAGTTDDSYVDGDGAVATTSFTDAGGAYTLNFAAADPSIYLPPIPFPSALGTDYVPGGRGDGSTLIPLADFNDGTSDVRVESLAPQDMALGQIVPFETKISVSGDTTPENGVITFVIGWNTLTTNSGDFGYDARGDDIGYGVIEAFIDTSDGAHNDLNDDAQVDSFTWSLINDEIVGVFTVSGLDDGDVVVLEPWLVLDDTIPAGIGGNVQSRLIDAATGSDQSITVANSGAISLDNGDSISTGNQTVPLLKPSDFFTADVDLSVIKSDNQDDPLVITSGDDPVTGTDFSVIQGQTLTYTIQVANAGPSVANTVVVYDELDPNVTFVSASDGGFINTDAGDTIPDGAVQWDLGALAAGESTELTVTVTVNADAPTGSPTADLLNTVTVTTISADTDLTNNTNTERTDVLAAIEPTDLTITKAAALADSGTAADEAGDVINYTITLDNEATSGSLTGVTVSDPLITDLAFAGGDADSDSRRGRRITRMSTGRILPSPSRTNCSLPCRPGLSGNLPGAGARRRLGWPCGAGLCRARF